MKWLEKFPLENILFDILLTLLLFFLPDQSVYLSNNLYPILWLIVPFHLAALFCAFYKTHEGTPPETEAKPVRKWLGLVYFFSLILAFGTNFWMLYLFKAVEKQHGDLSIWVERLVFIPLFFGGIAVFGLAMQLKPAKYNALLIRVVTALTVFVYIFVSESLLQITFSILDSSAMTVLAVMIWSYLPIRLLLALRPPFSIYDLFSALLFFGIFVSTLL